MLTVIGVRFRAAGKIYYFDPADRQIKIGDHVIVETARGIEYGYVVLGNREVDETKVIPPLKPVIRMATDEDRAIEAKNKEKEKEAFKICQEKIKKHNLEMKLIDAEYTFDNNKVLFYFTADGRIDFRELVKDLASVFKTRPRSWVVSASAEDRCAAILICLSSSRFLLKWQRSRTCP